MTLIEWKRYIELEPIKRLRENGRELLGREIYATVKRDGSNLSVWIAEDGEFKIASHNLEQASPELSNKLMATKEWERIKAFLTEETKQYGHRYIIYGEYIPAGYGATRIEPKHKNPTFEMFDILDTATGEFLHYKSVYQHGYHWKIQVVDLVKAFTPLSIEQITEEILALKKWSRRHRREGVVLKAYDPHPKWGQTYAKEKIDLPENLPKLDRQPKVTLPEMPPERILRALKHAFDTVGETNWQDRSKSMPEIARQLQVEAAEHAYSQPRNFYQIYLDTPIEKLRPVVET